MEYYSTTKRGWNSDTCYNRGEPINTKYKRQTQKEKRSMVPYTKYLEQANLKRQKYQRLPGAAKRGKVGNYFLMSRKSLFAVMKNEKPEIVLMAAQHCERKGHRIEYTTSKRVYFMFLCNIYTNPPSHTHTQAKNAPSSGPLHLLSTFSPHFM